MLNLSVTFHLHHGTIQRVELLPANEFSYTITGDLALSSRQAIDDWIDGYRNRQHLPLPLPLNWPELTPFTRSVLDSIAQVPFGDTCTYRDIADDLDNPGAVRAVGSACGRNPYPLLIPCHRVLAKGGIGGFTGGLEIKRTLLDWEL